MNSSDKQQEGFIMKAFEIFLDGRFVDTAYFGVPKTIKQAKASLIEDGHAKRITLKIVFLGGR